MTYLSWGTYCRFAGCAYFLGKTHSREAKVLFYHHPRGVSAPATDWILGCALPHKVTLNPHWTHTFPSPKAHQKAGNMIPNGSKLAPKGDFGPPFGMTLVQLYAKKCLSAETSIFTMSGHHLQAIWRPNPTPRVHKSISKYPYAHFPCGLLASTAILYDKSLFHIYWPIYIYIYNIS